MAEVISIKSKKPVNPDLDGSEPQYPGGVDALIRVALALSEADQAKMLATLRLEESRRNEKRCAEERERAEQYAREREERLRQEDEDRRRKVSEGTHYIVQIASFKTAFRKDSTTFFLHLFGVLIFIFFVCFWVWIAREEYISACGSSDEYCEAWGRSGG
jgi:hypothetical protein